MTLSTRAVHPTRSAVGFCVTLSTRALYLTRSVICVCRLRELEGSLKTLSQFFSLNEAVVQFELPGDVDNRVSVPRARLALGRRFPRWLVGLAGSLARPEVRLLEAPQRCSVKDVQQPKAFASRTPRLKFLPTVYMVRDIFGSRRTLGVFVHLPRCTQVLRRYPPVQQYVRHAYDVGRPPLRVRRTHQSTRDVPVDSCWRVQVVFCYLL